MKSSLVLENSSSSLDGNEIFRTHNGLAPAAHVQFYSDDEKFTSILQPLQKSMRHLHFIDHL